MPATKRDTDRHIDIYLWQLTKAAMMECPMGKGCNYELKKMENRPLGGRGVRRMKESWKGTMENWERSGGAKVL